MKNNQTKINPDVLPNPEMEQLLSLVFSLSNVEYITKEHAEMKGLLSKFDLDNFQVELKKAYKYTNLATFNRIKATFQEMMQDIRTFQKKNNHRIFSVQEVFSTNIYQELSENEKASYLLLYIVGYEFEQYRGHVCKKSGETIRTIDEVLNKK